MKMNLNHEVNRLVVTILPTEDGKVSVHVSARGSMEEANSSMTHSNLELMSTSSVVTEEQVGEALAILIGDSIIKELS